MKVQNRAASYFFSEFDFPIRFLYSRFHLNKLFFWKLYTSNFERLDQKFEKINKILKKNGFNLKNKVCLELGPGNSYINAYNFLMNGAKKVILVDKFPRYIKTKKQKEYLKRELDYIKKKYNKKELSFVKGDSLNKEYIQLITKDITNSGLKEKIDFVYSISVFEHIKDVEGNIKQLSKILKKGGLMCHSIDLRDHYNFNNPFLFYKYSKKTWEKYLTKEGVSYTNRIRYSEFKRLFKKYGFEIINEEIERFNIKKHSVSEEFNSNDKTLNVGKVGVLLRKK